MCQRLLWVNTSHFMFSLNKPNAYSETLLYIFQGEIVEACLSLALYHSGMHYFDNSVRVFKKNIA